MFADKRRVNRREFLRLGGAGLAGAGLLLGGVGCGGGEGIGENAIGVSSSDTFFVLSPSSLQPAKSPAVVSTNAMRTASTHAQETLLWASKGKGVGHTFNYDIINSPNPDAQVSSVWRIPSVPKVEKREGYHTTQKPLRLVRRVLLASTDEGDLVFDPFCGSGTTAVAAKELNRAFVGAELEEEFAKLAAR